MFWNNTNSQAKYLFSHSPNGFVFGKHHRKYVQKPVNIDGNILVVGESSSGKTTCIAIPTLKRWAGPVFVIDINGELIEKVANDRGIDNIKILNPSSTITCAYDPYFLLEHSEDQETEAKRLSMDICPLPPNSENQYFILAAQKILTGFLLYYHSLGFDFSATMLQIHSVPIRQQIDAILAIEGHPAKAYISQFGGMGNQVLSNIFSELTTCTEIFITPDFQRATARTGCFITPADLECGKDIFCCFPEDKIDQWQPLITLIIRQFLAYLDQRHSKNRPPILFLFDNFHRLGRIDQVALSICTMRGTNVTIAIFVQHINQIEKLYGLANKTVMVDCCFYSAHLSLSNEIDFYSPVGNFLIYKISDEV